MKMLHYNIYYKWTALFLLFYYVVLEDLESSMTNEPYVHEIGVSWERQTHFQRVFGILFDDVINLAERQVLPI